MLSIANLARWLSGALERNPVAGTVESLTKQCESVQYSTQPTSVLTQNISAVCCGYPLKLLGELAPRNFALAKSTAVTAKQWHWYMIRVIRLAYSDYVSCGLPLRLVWSILCVELLDLYHRSGLATFDLL
jgi:hypothetical protein